MSTLLRSTLLLRRRSRSSQSSFVSSSYSPTSSGQRKVATSGGKISLSKKAIQFLDDGDTSDGHRTQEYDDDINDINNNVKEEVVVVGIDATGNVDDDSDLVPMDESPIIRTNSKRSKSSSSHRTRSLVNVLINDNCVGIVVNDTLSSDEENDNSINSCNYNNDDEYENEIKTECNKDPAIVVDDNQQHSINTYDDDDDDDVDDNMTVTSEIINAGNEALLLIYGHNVNLYTDVFQLPSAPPVRTRRSRQYNSDDDDDILSTDDELILLAQINQSYEEIYEQLQLALNCIGTAYQREAAMVCGYTDRFSTIMKNDPKMFLDIKVDAVRRARDILLHDDSRNEYNEMLWKYSNSHGNNDGVGAATTTTTTTVAAASDTVTTVTKEVIGTTYDVVGDTNYFTDHRRHFDVKDNNSDDDDDDNEYDNDDAIYGSHGDYSYDCHEEEDVCSLFTVPPGITDYSNRNLQPIPTHQVHVVTEIEESFQPQKNNDDHGGEDFDSLIQDRQCQSKLGQIMWKQDQYSPTNQEEFDLLIENSLPEEEFYDQLIVPPSKKDTSSIIPLIPRLESSPPPSTLRGAAAARRRKHILKTREGDDNDTPGGKVNKLTIDNDVVFDPFNLMNDNQDDSVTTVSVPDVVFPNDPFFLQRNSGSGEWDDAEQEDQEEHGSHNNNQVTETVTFVCPLPRSNIKDDDEYYTHRHSGIVDLDRTLSSDAEDDTNNIESSVFGDIVSKESGGVFDDVIDDVDEEDDEYDENNLRPGLIDLDQSVSHHDSDDEDDAVDEIPEPLISSWDDYEDRFEGMTSWVDPSLAGNSTSRALKTETAQRRSDDECIVSKTLSSYQEPKLEEFKEKFFLEVSATSPWKHEQKLKKNRSVRKGLKARVRKLVSSLRTKSKNKIVSTKNGSSISSASEAELEEAEVLRLLGIASTFNVMEKKRQENELRGLDLLDENDSEYDGYFSSSSQSQSYESDTTDKLSDETKDDEIVSRVMKLILSLSQSGSEEGSVCSDEKSDKSTGGIDCFNATSSIASLEDGRHTANVKSGNVSYDDESGFRNSTGQIMSAHDATTPSSFFDMCFNKVCKSTDDALNAVESFFYIGPDTLPPPNVSRGMYDNGR